MISFFIPLPPKQKGNSKRFVLVPRRGRAPLPRLVGRDEDVQAERDVARLAARFAPPTPMTGPIRLDVTFVMGIPPSWPRRRRQRALAGEVLPTVRPDRGNLQKLLEDALQKAGFYADDAQIIAGEPGQIYGITPGYAIHLASATAGDWARLHGRVAGVLGATADTPAADTAPATGRPGPSR